MATTYSQQRSAIKEINDRLDANRKRLSGAKSQIAVAKSDLDAIPISLKIFLDDISKAASDDPDNPAYKLASSEAIILLNECVELSQTADSMVKAIDAI